MTSPSRFDRRHGKGAFLRLCAMLADPAFAYQQIGDKFGMTRQSVFAIATELGVDGQKRRHERAFRVRPHVIRRFKKYPPAIQAVMDKLKRAGLQVASYNAPQPARPNCLVTSLKMILVNGVLCTKKDAKGRAHARAGAGCRDPTVWHFAMRRPWPLRVGRSYNPRARVAPESLLAVVTESAGALATAVVPLCNPSHLNVISMLFGFREVILHLQPKPYFGTRAKRLGKPDGHFRRHAGLLVHNVVKRLASHAEALRGIGYRYAQRLNALLAHDPAGMRRFLHTHKNFLLLVIIDQINIAGVAFIKAKNDAPICPDCNAPEVFEIALQAMQFEAGQVHVLGPPGSIQNGEDILYFFNMLSLEQLTVGAFK
jgi:hypothetical protein